MYNFRQLSKHIKILEYGDNDNTVLGYIYGTNGAVVSDGAASEKHVKKFFSHLTKEETTNIKGVYITHHHWDHTLGAHYLNAPVYCSEKTAPYFKEYAKSSWNLDDIENKYANGELFEFGYNNMKNELTNKPLVIAKPFVVKDSITIDLGGVTVTYEPIESCHCSDCSVIYVKEDKTIFLGDILWPNMESDNNNWYYSLSEVKNMYEQLKKYDAEIFIDSHDDPMTKQHFEYFMNRLIFMLEYSLKNKGCSFEEISDSVPKELQEYKVCYDNLLKPAIQKCKK